MIAAVPAGDDRGGAGDDLGIDIAVNQRPLTKRAAGAPVAVLNDGFMIMKGQPGHDHEDFFG